MVVPATPEMAPAVAAAPPVQVDHTVAVMAVEDVSLSFSIN